MNTFNNNSRKKNIIYSSAAGVSEQALIYLFNFIFRTIFLLVLPKNYLGISGLFTNILQLLSLTELGIGTIISFRLYEPIKGEDLAKCHALMEFYKRAYYLIGIIVTIICLAIYPFLDYFIANSKEIPPDINLKVIYFLFVFQNATSYFFVYAQSLLSADQKNYIISVANIIYSFFLNSTKIIVLLFSNDYTLSLAFGILINLIYNFTFNTYIKKNYSLIFNQASILSPAEKKSILKDTVALLCHKIGYIVLNSTDNLILSKHLGLITVALYSNYSLISNAIDAFLNKLLGSFISSIGNKFLDQDLSENNLAYERLLFLNYALVSIFCICFFNLINPFIMVWLDKSFLLTPATVVIITLILFCNSSGIINSAFINASGLFVKDKLRPLIQAIINLIASIYLVKRVGITGVFLGTLISILLTTWWRQPFLVYKLILKKPLIIYFLRFFKWFFSSIIISIGVSLVLEKMPDSVLFLVLKFLLCALFVPPAVLICNYNLNHLKYFKTQIVSIISKKHLGY